MSGKGVRLDVLLVERGLADSREKARALIMTGKLRVDGRNADKAAAMVRPDAEIEGAVPSPYVSRGGFKLAHALDAFGMDVTGKVALDAGASTGGFTDVLLQRGAARVYAVDVGYGQLAWSVRSDPRVVVMERTNVRFVDELPERPLLITADLSFISLRLVLEKLTFLAQPDADFTLLIKPQFEAGRTYVGKGGVVRNPAVHRAVLRAVVDHAAGLSLSTRGLVRSPITGPAGNIEFLIWLRRGEQATPDPEDLIGSVVEVDTQGDGK